MLSRRVFGALAGALVGRRVAGDRGTNEDPPWTHKQGKRVGQPGLWRNLVLGA
jgi:hypothetical protein